MKSLPPNVYYSNYIPVASGGGVVIFALAVAPRSVGAGRQAAALKLRALW